MAWEIGLWILGLFILALIASSIRIIQQYERGVRFRLGKFQDSLNPGLNFIIPIFDHVRKVDMRILTLDIPNQQVITKDNVPVMINGVVYFRVEKAEDAIIKVQDYIYAVSQYAQTALRDVVGNMPLDDVLSKRETIGEEIEKVVNAETSHWGIRIENIKLQDIDMAEDLKRLMSRQASSEREKRATIIKAEGDRMAAENLAKAAKIMATTPGAMQLRTLQTIDGLGPSPSNTVILAIPVDLMDTLSSLNRILKKRAK
ncbi:MAG: slipin family protein [Candidatus Diapherotrites archaeon]